MKSATLNKIKTDDNRRALPTYCNSASHMLTGLKKKQFSIENGTRQVAALRYMKLPLGLN
jgi:hypothetical protein